MNKINLVNFQAHADTTIECHPRITALTGATDQSKSSVVRAIKLVTSQRPVGIAYIRKKQKKCTVSIDNVSFTKTKSAGAYNVVGHPEPYKALRGAVPETVTKELNLSPDNIQEQHRESIFLLDKSPGKVALKLSELVDLDASTESLKFLAHSKRTASTELKATKKSIEINEKLIESLRHVDAIDTELALLERKDKQVKRLTKKYTKVLTAYESALGYAKELDNLPNVDALAPAKHILEVYKEYNDLVKEENKLAETIRSTSILAHAVEADPTELLKKAHELGALDNEINAITFASKSVEAAINNSKVYDKKLKKLLQEKKLALGDTCPLCGESTIELRVD